MEGKKRTRSFFTLVQCTYDTVLYARDTYAPATQLHLQVPIRRSTQDPPTTQPRPRVPKWERYTLKLALFTTIPIPTTCAVPYIFIFWKTNSSTFLQRFNFLNPIHLHITSTIQFFFWSIQIYLFNCCVLFPKNWNSRNFNFTMPVWSEVTGWRSVMRKLWWHSFQFKPQLN